MPRFEGGEILLVSVNVHGCIGCDGFRIAARKHVLPAGRIGLRQLVGSDLEA